jgi:hypothetical protein
MRDPSQLGDGVTLALAVTNLQVSGIGVLLMMWSSFMTLICARTASASVRRPVLLAFPLALVLAACGGREQMAIAPHATEGYGSSSPPRASPPSLSSPYAPYERLTNSARRSNLQ